MAEEFLTDDEQWEAVKRWIVENGLWVIAGVVLGIVALVGYRYVDSSRNERALRASAQFAELASALDRNDRDKARNIAEGLIKQFPSSPYADQAELALARLFVDAGQPPSAVAPLTQVMSQSKDTELRHVARLRLARVLIDEGKPDDAIKTLAEDTPGAFAALYHEVRGDAFLAKKDVNSALTQYKAALSSADGAGAQAGLLQLKIADLGVPPTPPTAMVPVTAPNKAKP